MSSSTLVYGKVPGAAHALGVVARRAYRIVAGGRAAPLPERPGLPEEPVFAPSSNDPSTRRLVEDAAGASIGKALTDVLVRGSARSLRGSVTTLETAILIGVARKSVRANGERRVVLGAGGALGFSAPLRFTELPLIWDHAYGGRDRRAEARFMKDRGAERRLFSVTYPRNMAGRGYALDFQPEKLEGSLAPSLEDPTDPVTPDRLLSKTTVDWIDRPVAACYEPIDVFTFPRALFFVKPKFEPPTRPVHELASGAVLRADLDRPFDMKAVVDPRLFNSAPAGLATCRLTGAERVSVWNMHLKHEFLEFDLPDDCPRLSIEPPGVAMRELPAKLQTVLVEPDEDRVTLTWTGLLPVATEYSADARAAVRHDVVWSR